MPTDPKLPRDDKRGSASGGQNTGKTGPGGERYASLPEAQPINEPSPWLLDEWDREFIAGLPTPNPDALREAR